ncbi:tamavidin1 [Mycena vitilis]|nr:tamavidin1 [Mycena vitilis]
MRGRRGIFSRPDFSGTWFNELGSQMVLVANASGTISGQYNSAVGEAQDFYVLAGRFDTAPPAPTAPGDPAEGVSIGWTVAWHNTKENAHSNTVWSGQFFDKDASGDQRILTQWFLTTSSTPADLWSSTQVGHDEFGRAQPSAADIARARAFKRGSPYPEAVALRR